MFQKFQFKKKQTDKPGEKKLPPFMQKLKPKAPDAKQEEAPKKSLKNFKIPKKGA